MDYFWIVPVLIIGPIAIWILYRKVMREGGQGVRSEGKVLLDKPPPPESESKAPEQAFTQFRLPD